MEAHLVRDHSMIRRKYLSCVNQFKYSAMWGRPKISYKDESELALRVLCVVCGGRDDGGLSLNAC